MANFSDAVRIICHPRSHPAQSDFFELVIARVQLGNILLYIAILKLEAGDFISVGFAHGVARQALLAGLKEVLAPGVIQIRIDAFLATQLGNRTLAS